MAFKKFTELPSATVLTGSEVLPLVQGATSKKTTVAAVDTYVKSVALPSRLPFISGKWYSTVTAGIIAAGTANAVDTIRLFPVIFDKSVTISAVAFRVSATGTNAQIAIYGADSATGLPSGAVLRSTASINVNSTGVKESAFSGGSVTLVPGIYWFASNVDNATTGFACVTTANISLASLMYGATSASLIAAAGTGMLTYAVVAQTYGTWPTMTGATLAETSSSTFPFVVFQVA